MMRQSSEELAFIFGWSESLSAHKLSMTPSGSTESAALTCWNQMAINLWSPRWVVATEVETLGHGDPEEGCSPIFSTHASQKKGLPPGLGVCRPEVQAGIFKPSQDSSSGAPSLCQVVSQIPKQKSSACHTHTSFPLQQLSPCDVIWSTFYLLAISFSLLPLPTDRWVDISFSKIPGKRVTERDGERGREMERGIETLSDRGHSISHS